MIISSMPIVPVIDSSIATVTNAFLKSGYCSNPFLFAKARMKMERDPNNKKINGRLVNHALLASFK